MRRHTLHRALVILAVLLWLGSAENAYAQFATQWRSAPATYTRVQPNNCIQGRCPQPVAPRPAVEVRKLRPAAPRTALRTPSNACARIIPGLPSVTAVPVTQKPPVLPMVPVRKCNIGPRLDAIESALTALTGKVDNVETTQALTATVLSEMASTQVGTNDKLDAAIVLLQEHNSQPIDVTLTVQSQANLPASYVDTSTIWAIQRRTGLSNAVLVINSDDPEWVRLEVEYVKARHKFPAMQLVDVKSGQLQISPTPQLVLYYVDEGRQPDVISGDRGVSEKLRELYTN